MSKITDEKIERIAKILTTRLGENPYDTVLYSDPVNDVVLYTPRWTLYRDEIKRYIEIKEAIEMILNEDTDDGG